MRFAYIDSQGNEVPIPSVDALALRIELGAIGPQTQLYDAQADHWAPAETHEIYHTLAREQEDDGFVPPPVAPPPSYSPPPDEPDPADSEQSEPAQPGTADADGLAADSDPAEAGAPAPSDLEPEGAAEPEPDAEVSPPAEAPAADDLGFDLDLALTEAPGADPEDTEPAESPASDAPESEFGFDMVPADVDPTPSEAPEAAEEDMGFGDLGVLEMEAPLSEEEADEEEAPMSFGGGMMLEEPLADGDDLTPTEGIGGGLDLETPMSEFDTDAPPAWMEQAGPGASPQEESADADALDLSPGAGTGSGAASAVPTDEASERRQRQEPRSRPSPPRRRKKSKLPMIAGVLVVVSVGGYFGWQTLSGRPAQPAAEEEMPPLPPVVIPDIPAELLPTMRDLAEAALGETVAALGSMQSEFDLIAEPQNEWLSGAYLGSASQFPGVEQYWLGVEAFVDRVREVDTAVFHDMYVLQTEAAGLDDQTSALLVERADSGFLASREARFEAYRQMDDLINAALDLHLFLVENEADIKYEPAAGGISRDPVLEAIPSTEALGEEMWGLVDNITDALDRLGTLNRVTTERLFAVIFDRIRRAGVQ